MRSTVAQVASREFSDIAGSGNDYGSGRSPGGDRPVRAQPRPRWCARAIR